jgi:hypothetical protein
MFFLFSKITRPALRLTQPPIQWVPGLVPGVKKEEVLNLTTYFHLVLRLRMSGVAFWLLPYTFVAWRRI